MALSIAIPLSGLEWEQFNNLSKHLRTNKIDYKIMQPDEELQSPSIRSDSDSTTSGVSSLFPLSNYTTPASSLSPMSSRSITPSLDKESTDDNTGSESGVSTTDSTIFRPKINYRHRLLRKKSNKATDLSDLNLLCRRLLQIPAGQPYRLTPKTSQRPIKTNSTVTNDVKSKKSLKIMYGNRDILNLQANLREPSWQMRTPSMPYNIKYFKANRSIYHRLSERGLTEEYPMKSCKDCNFYQPCF